MSKADKVILSPYMKIFYNEWVLNPHRSDYNVVIDRGIEGYLDISRLDNAVKRFVSDYFILNSH